MTDYVCSVDGNQRKHKIAVTSQCADKTSLQGSGKGRLQEFRNTIPVMGRFSPYHEFCHGASNITALPANGHVHSVKL